MFLSDDQQYDLNNCTLPWQGSFKEYEVLDTYQPDIDEVFEQVYQESISPIQCDLNNQFSEFGNASCLEQHISPLKAANISDQPEISIYDILEGKNDDQDDFLIEEEGSGVNFCILSLLLLLKGAAVAIIRTCHPLRI